MFWDRSHLKVFAVIASTVALLYLTDGLRNSLVLPDIMQDFATLALSIFVEALPFVALGAFLATVVNNYVSAEKMLGLLPKSGLMRRGAVSTLGFFMPVCECGNVCLLYTSPSPRDRG